MATKGLTIDGKNVEIKLRGKRISFPNLFEPQEQENDNGEKTYKYNEVVLLDKVKDVDDIALVKEAMKEARRLRWGDQAPVIPAERLCLRDGEPINEETGKPQALYDGYAGMMFLSASRGVKKRTDKNPVQLYDNRRDADGNWIKLTDQDGKLYGGSYGTHILRIYAFDGTGKGPNGKNLPNRINCSLEVVMHHSHGDPFGAKKVNANSAFDDEDADTDAGEIETSAPKQTAAGEVDPLA